MLSEAAMEIRELRRVNEILEAKVSTMNLFAVALGMKSGGEASRPDPLWRMEKHLEQMIQVDKVSTRLRPPLSKDQESQGAVNAIGVAVDPDSFAPIF